MSAAALYLSDRNRDDDDDGAESTNERHAVRNDASQDVTDCDDFDECRHIRMFAKRTEMGFAGMHNDSLQRAAQCSNGCMDICAMLCLDGFGRLVGLCSSSRLSARAELFEEATTRRACGERHPSCRRCAAAFRRCFYFGTDPRLLADTHTDAASTLRPGCRSHTLLPMATTHSPRLLRLHISICCPGTCTRSHVHRRSTPAVWPGEAHRRLQGLCQATSSLKHEIP